MNANRWLAFAGGASVGLLAGRVLLSPVLSAGMSYWDRARGSSPFEVLADDHRRFRELLGEMVMSQGRSRLYRGQLLLRLKRGLAAHAMAEEDVIYPLLVEEADAAAVADHFYSDHGLMKTHLYALEHCLDDEIAFTGRSAELKDLVERHARQEEEREFPRLQALMNDAEVAHVAWLIRREKGMVL